MIKRGYLFPIFLILFSISAFSVYADKPGSCLKDGSKYCDKQSPDGCFCDSVCTQYGDCCSDYKQTCQDQVSAPPLCGTGSTNSNCVCQGGYIKSPLGSPATYSCIKCPFPSCAAPPANCHYEGLADIDSNGCKTGCGKLVCDDKKCATYTSSGIEKEICATCGNNACEPYETCTPSSCTQDACTSGCGGLYCPNDCDKPKCGNEKCEQGEDELICAPCAACNPTSENPCPLCPCTKKCPQDCDKPKCGDGICEVGEANKCPACTYSNPPCSAPCTSGTCPQDCPDKIAKEQVKCIFKNSNSMQECYSKKGSCKGTQSCVIDVAGKKGEQITWKSSCGEYAYTTIDGQNEYAYFDCNTENCVDSDGGENYYVLGTVQSHSGGEVPPAVATDFCNGKSLTEYYCTVKGFNSVSHSCYEGCKNGACQGIHTGNFSIADISDKKSSYSTNEKSTLKIKAVEPDGTPAESAEGFNVQWSIQTVTNDESFDSGNAAYKNGYWYADITTPKYAGNYNMVVFLYCSQDNSACTKKYGNGAQVEDWSIIKVDTGGNPICTDSDGGKDYYVKGTAEEKGTTNVFTDICDSELTNPGHPVDANLLYEYFCGDGQPGQDFQAGQVFQDTYYCPSGCKNGACTLSTVTLEKLETDMNYYGLNEKVVMTATVTFTNGNSLESLTAQVSNPKYITSEVMLEKSGTCTSPVGGSQMSCNYKGTFKDTSLEGNYYATVKLDTNYYAGYAYFSVIDKAKAAKYIILEGIGPYKLYDIDFESSDYQGYQATYLNSQQSGARVYALNFNSRNQMLKFLNNLLEEYEDSYDEQYINDNYVYILNQNGNPEYTLWTKENILIAAEPYQNYQNAGSPKDGSQSASSSKNKKPESISSILGNAVQETETTTTSQKINVPLPILSAYFKKHPSDLDKVPKISKQDVINWIKENCNSGITINPEVQTTNSGTSGPTGAVVAKIFTNNKKYWKD